MDALRGEADVAYVEREATLSIRDAPPARVADAAFANARTWEAALPAPSKNAAATLIPNDHFYPTRCGRRTWSTCRKRGP